MPLNSIMYYSFFKLFLKILKSHGYPNKSPKIIVGVSESPSVVNQTGRETNTSRPYDGLC